MLGVSEDLLCALCDLCLSMEPEDGDLTLYGISDDETPAFTRDGIDRLRELFAEFSQLDLPQHPQ